MALARVWVSLSRSLLLLGLLGLLLVLAGCISEGEPASLEERAQAIDKRLMCPVCPSETIDQSQVELAKQMRILVREKLAQGWSKAEILQFFVDRYGPGVLAEPPKRGFNLLVWVIPPVALVLGSLILVMAVREMRRPRLEYAVYEGPASMAGLEPYLAVVDREIEALVTTEKESSSGPAVDEPRKATGGEADS